jgi:hypothetical protein
MKTHLSIRQLVLRLAPLAVCAFTATLGTAQASQPRTANPVDPQIPERTDPVNFGWLLGDMEPSFATAPQPISIRSREWIRQVTGQELTDGLSFYSSAPETLLLVQPLGTSSSRNLASLRISSAQSEAVGQASPARAEAQSGGDASPIRPGAQFLRIETPPGSALQLEGSTIEPEANYIVHVVERASDLELAVAADRAHFFLDESIEISFAVNQGEDDVGVRRVAAFLRSAGQPLVEGKAVIDGNVGRVSFERLGIQANALGLISAHVEIEGVVDGKPFLRTAMLPIPVAARTAELRSIDVNSDLETASVTAEVLVATPGRYEIRTIFEVNGRAVAVHSAAELDEGMQTLTARVEPGLVAKLGSVKNIQLREIRLMDLSRMGQLAYRSYESTMRADL